VSRAARAIDAGVLSTDAPRDGKRHETPSAQTSLHRILSVKQAVAVPRGSITCGLPAEACRTCCQPLGCTHSVVMVPGRHVVRIVCRCNNTNTEMPVDVAARCVFEYRSVAPALQARASSILCMAYT